MNKESPKKLKYRRIYYLYGGRSLLHGSWPRKFVTSDNPNLEPFYEHLYRDVEVVRHKCLIKSVCGLNKAKSPHLTKPNLPRAPSVPFIQMGSGNGRVRVPTSRGPIAPHVHSDISTDDPEAKPIIIEMPTNAASAGYFSALKGFCEFPALNQLGNDQDECFVCREPFNEGSEPPIKLACSHVFGMTCINIWALDKMDGGDEPDCPICRAHLLSAEGAVSPGSVNFATT